MELVSSYKQFIDERDKIDYFIYQGYQITSVTEDLNGDCVQFELQSKDEKINREKKTLHISNADARKYFSTIMMKQQRIDSK